MLRRALVLALVAGGLAVAVTPAQATCTAGYVGIDKQTLKPRIELPRCEPPPTR